MIWLSQSDAEGSEVLHSVTGDVGNPKELKLAPGRVGTVHWLYQRDPGRVVEYWKEGEEWENIPEGQEEAEAWSRGVQEVLQ